MAQWLRALAALPGSWVWSLGLHWWLTTAGIQHPLLAPVHTCTHVASTHRHTCIHINEVFRKHFFLKKKKSPKPGCVCVHPQSQHACPEMGGGSRRGCLGVCGSAGLGYSTWQTQEHQQGGKRDQTPEPRKGRWGEDETGPRRWGTELWEQKPDVKLTLTWPWVMMSPPELSGSSL